MSIKFTVGYQPNELLKKSVLMFADRISEIYFPWVGISSGRGVPLGESFTEKLNADLSEFTSAGISTNLLLNGNCYGRKAQARSFFNQIGELVDYLSERFALSSITTTSPLIAKFVKNNFKDVATRASVNMEIGTPDAIEYLAEHFDGFYIKREYNWDIARLKSMRKKTLELGKTLHILANSGCLNFCPARTFHDNLVAHQHEIAEMDNAFNFKGLCHDFLSKEDAKQNLLSRLNFIRPEDVHLFENFCDSMKLATRVHHNPSAIVQAYCSAHYSGNLLELTEPSHASNFYPQIIANDKIPSDYATRRLRCSHECSECGLCKEAQKLSTITIS